MREIDIQQSGMFSYLSPEERVPESHPLRPIRKITDEVLAGLSAKFNVLYATTGRPSIAPEKLLRALLLQILYTVRSERLLMEQLQYNLLFRWFAGLNMDEPCGWPRCSQGIATACWRRDREFILRWLHVQDGRPRAPTRGARSSACPEYRVFAAALTGINCDAGKQAGP